MKQFNIWLLSTTLILIVFLFSISSRIKKIKSENRVLNNNIESLLDDIGYYSIRDSINVATIRTMSLKVSDYERFRQNDAQIMRDMNIKIKNMQSVSKNVTNTNYVISAPISSQKFSYKSAYIDLKGTLINDSVSISLDSYDTLIQVVHRVPRKFLFFRYGTKYLRQEIMSTNPHTKIIYSEFIELVR